jgi:hypothetical protein
MHTQGGPLSLLQGCGQWCCHRRRPSCITAAISAPIATLAAAVPLSHHRCVPQLLVHVPPQVLQGRSHALLQETGVNIVDIMREEGFYVQRRVMSAPVKTRRCAMSHRLCWLPNHRRSCTCPSSQLVRLCRIMVVVAIGCAGAVQPDEFWRGRPH